MRRTDTLDTETLARRTMAAQVSGCDSGLLRTSKIENHSSSVAKVVLAERLNAVSHGFRAQTGEQVIYLNGP
jgi:hypothetical protein